MVVSKQSPATDREELRTAPMVRGDADWPMRQVQKCTPATNSSVRDGIGRRKRLTPQSSGKRVTLQPRDWAWLKLIHTHGALASSFLLEATRHNHASEKRAKERLTDLFNEDHTPHGGPYLTRPPQQFLTLDSRYNQLVYDLAPAGERALNAAGQWREKNKSGGGPWLHQFMVSSITASIQLAVDARDDLQFISQADILERAKADLSWPVTIVDPVAKRLMTKDLIPDALFGLEYKIANGSRYRFFAIEADRATEPLTSRNFNRKSALRNLLQYRAYIAEGAYKEHLNLSAPLLVLNVSSDLARTKRMIKLVSEHSPGGNPYMLFQTWGAFAPPFRPPMPNCALLDRPWQRSGLGPFCITSA